MNKLIQTGENSNCGIYSQGSPPPLKRESTLTIFMAILCQAIMANISKIAVMAILVWVEMATNMVNMGVSAKNRQNVDSLRKRIGKNRIGKKVMAKTKYFVKKGSKWTISFVFLSET